jgi:hypothetical protein
MTVEPHWYIINTVYIGYQFSNILLKKCKGLLTEKIIHTRQLKQLSEGNIATTKS